MEPGHGPHPDWLFAEPAPSARRRARTMKAACAACGCVVVVGFGLTFGGYMQAMLAALVACVLAAWAGVEAYWAGEIATRAEAREER